MECGPRPALTVGAVSVKVDGGASKRNHMKYFAWPEKAAEAPAQPRRAEKFKLAARTRLKKDIGKDGACQTCPCVFWTFFYHRGFQCLLCRSSVIQRRMMYLAGTSTEEAGDPRGAKERKRGRKISGM